jgi:hypothetical protein
MLLILADLGSIERRSMGIRLWLEARLHPTAKGIWGSKCRGYGRLNRKTDAERIVRFVELLNVLGAWVSNLRTDAEAWASSKTALAASSRWLRI